MTKRKNGEEGCIIDQDAYYKAIMNLNQTVYRILEVNLTDDTYRNVRNVQCREGKQEEHVHFSSMLQAFMQQGWVHPEDEETYVRSTELEYLRDWVKREKRGEIFVYRRKLGDDYHWCSVSMYPCDDYTKENQKVYLIIRDIHRIYSKRLEQQHGIEMLAMTDPLTGLKNRLAYTRCCDDYAREMRRHSVGVIFADVNGLKFVNDSYGHKNGDEYLLTFANTLLNLYGKDNCYRISGDEFLVVLEYFSKSHFVEEVSRLKEFLDGQSSPMASLGAYWDKEPASIELLEREAEKYMYQDKQCYYKKYHNVERDRLNVYDAQAFDVENVLAAKEENRTYYGREDLDTSGLSSRVFDVFSATARRNYLFMTNMWTNVSHWSPRAVEYFDLPGEYMYKVDEIWEPRIHPEDRAKYRKSLEDLFSGKTTFHDISYRVKNAQGQYVMCACEGRIIKGYQDEPDYFAGTIINYGIPDTVDRITNLPSKTAFQERLRQMTREECNSAVLMLVIDMFSSINSLYGYGVGEKILQLYGKKLMELVGDLGQIYHMDGAAFCICMDGVEKEEVQKLYQKIQRMGYERISIGELQVTLKTLGSATVFGYAKGKEELINSSLNYIIGKSREVFHSGLVFFDIDDHIHEMNDRDVLGVIYQDIMGDFSGFRVFYQPIVQAWTGAVVGAEALVRWESESYGMVTPGRFIPYIEQNPCIYELGNWVLKKALEDAKQMRDIVPEFIVNVNVAPPQLERSEFRGDVIRLLEETGYPPENLCLELTERCRELDFDFLREQINFFRGHNVRIAMDDFGTGNASLQLALELPVDEIKIDRAFIQDIQNQQLNQVLVSGIVRGAKAMKADICIEGIESEELGNYLQQYNPTYYQGYFYSRPISKEDFMQLILPCKKDFMETEASMD